MLQYLVVFIMQGLHFLDYILGEAPWWKRLFKPSMWKDPGREEVRLHPGSRSSGRREGGPRGPGEGVFRPEGAQESPVSIHNYIG